MTKRLSWVFAVALICFFAILFACCVPQTQSHNGGASDIEKIETRFLAAFSSIYIYDSDELTGDILRNRTGMVIERCVGVVENSRGDGRILNGDPEFNYISYEGSNIWYSTGDIILTYLVYDPLGNGEDDVIDRYDFNLSSDGDYSGRGWECIDNTKDK